MSVSLPEYFSQINTCVPCQDRGANYSDVSLSQADSLSHQAAHATTQMTLSCPPSAPCL